MHVGVIGAGLVGVMTAHALKRRGMDVTVLDAKAAAGTGTSYANGGQLAYGNATPLGSPAVIASLVSILLGRARGIRVNFRADPAFWRWATRFLWHCLPRPYRRNADVLSRIACQSSDLMQAYHEQFGDSYDYARSGKLVILPAGDPTADLDTEEVHAIDPALLAWNLPVGKASFASGDEVGDASKFTSQLACQLAASGVQFQFDAPVRQIERHGKGWGVVVEGQAPQRFDRLILCAGCDVRRLLSPLGVSCDIYPVAGYSYSFAPGPSANRTSVTIARDRIVFSRLGETLRVAGYANVNASQGMLRVHAEEMLRKAMEIAPEAANYDTSAEPWIGYRPATPSSLPIVGETKHPGLFVNSGHGMLGWTLGAASALSVAQLVSVRR